MEIVELRTVSFQFEEEELPPGIIGKFRARVAIPEALDYNGRPIAPDARFSLMYPRTHMPLLWAHDPARPIGHVEVHGDGEEIAPPITLTGYIADIALGRDALTLIRAGSLQTMSFGLVRPRYRDGSIVGGQILEFSLVATPSQPDARIEEVVAYAVVPYQDWPIYRDRKYPWDRDEAEKRIRRWAGRGRDPARWGSEEWKRYRSCFLIYDREKPENLTGYKLLICDVVDRRVYAIPRAIFAAGAALANPETYRGRGLDASEEDIQKARRHLERYYRKMREMFDDPSIIPPWEDERKILTALLFLI